MDFFHLHEQPIQFLVEYWVVIQGFAEIKTNEPNCTICKGNKVTEYSEQLNKLKRWQSLRNDKCDKVKSDRGDKVRGKWQGWPPPGDSKEDVHPTWPRLPSQADVDTGR